MKDALRSIEAGVPNLVKTKKDTHGHTHTHACTKHIWGMCKFLRKTQFLAIFHLSTASFVPM